MTSWPSLRRGPDIGWPRAGSSQYPGYPGCPSSRAVRSQGAKRHHQTAKPTDHSRAGAVTPQRAMACGARWGTETRKAVAAPISSGGHQTDAGNGNGRPVWRRLAPPRPRHRPGFLPLPASPCPARAETPEAGSPDPTPLDDEFAKYSKCPYCGMDRQKWHFSRHLVHYDNDVAEGACSLRCAAVSLAVNLRRVAKAIYAPDNGSGEPVKPLVNAELAIYVIGGNHKPVMDPGSQDALRLTAGHRGRPGRWQADRFRWRPEIGLRPPGGRHGHGAPQGARVGRGSRQAIER